MNSQLVKDVMTRLVVTCRPEDSIKQAGQRLIANRISGAPVVDGGKLVGVVSEIDLVHALAPPILRRPFDALGAFSILLRGAPLTEDRNATVRDVMTRDVISIASDARVDEAAYLIDRFGVRRLPVVDEENYVVGVVARSDLVRAMVQSDAALLGLDSA